MCLFDTFITCMNSGGLIEWDAWAYYCFHYIHGVWIVDVYKICRANKREGGVLHVLRLRCGYERVLRFHIQFIHLS